MKRISKALAALLAAATLLAACAPAASDASAASGASQSAAGAEAYHKITAEEAKRMLDEDPDAVVVDVRRQDEYDVGHIPGALLVPNETIGDEQPALLPDLDATLLVHCRTGVRSKQASDKLVALGYKNVYDFGGIVDWPYETITSAEEEGGQTVAGAAQELTTSEKAIPGCRVDLPYPLQMTGKSLATDFSRWSATDLDGNLVTEEVLAGSKLTLVGVWSSYCSSCVADLEAMQQLYETYPRDQLNVIGIVASSQNRDGTINEGEVEITRQLQEITGAQFLQLLPSDDLIQIKLKDLDRLPESFLLDSDGNLVGDSQVGQRSVEEFRELIDAALATLG